MALAFHRAAAADLDASTLYRILRLRVDVFVVEQACPYPELDGRDLDPDAELLWASEGDAVLATLRILRDEDAARIGRVVTAPPARGDGVGAQLMRQ
ncbi:MAG: GNAT family N-acetyltransferase, partial [Microbacterium sp.]